jgi:5-methyltetrahydrofolate--homocysteine methyltransferase
VHPTQDFLNAYGGYDETAQSMASHIREFADEQMINIAEDAAGLLLNIYMPSSGFTRNCTQKNSFCQKIYRTLGLQPLIIDSNSLFVNIGERTNVAGSARFKKLIAAENYEQAVDVAREQVNGGAQIIDINMDDSMIEGLKAMTSFLRLIGSEPEISTVPVMVDSSKWEIIEAALRSIQGKAIVNSISLKEGEGPFIEKAMKIKRYGAAIVVMAFDEQGQAESFQRKIDICSRAYKLLTEKAVFLLMILFWILISLL